MTESELVAELYRQTAFNAAILLVVATLGSTMLLLSSQQLTLSFNFVQWPAHLVRTKLITETALFTGILALFLTVALSGFIKSRQTGIVTAVPALIGVCLTLMILMPTF